MTIAVIVSTYNQPRWLALALDGWCRQQRVPNEILIADDGSDHATREVVNAFRSKLNIIHVWHPDVGFRKTEILNATLHHCTSDYVIFSDGDCIPRNDFVATHARFAHPLRFLSGGYHKLPMFTSEQITEASPQCFDRRWLKKNGMPSSVKNLKLMVRGQAASILDALTTTRPTWNGHNASGWRQDLLNVNGFDTRMRYGGEDRELGERLENAGIEGYGIRYRAVCVHLDHARGYVNTEAIARNHEIRAETKGRQLTRTEFGLAEQDLSNIVTLRGM